MHCHVLVPDAFWPRQDNAEVMAGLGCEGLEALIAKGRRTGAPPVAAECWLLDRFEVERQRDWPVAPYCLLADGRASGIAPGNDVWMRADPGHLHVDYGDLVLGDAGASAQDEAASLAQDINRHFAGSFELFPLCADRWYLRLPSVPDIETEPLAGVLGRSINAHLPSGPDAARWRSIANELQMLLHAHPVNAAREARGERALNSLWLWGAGRLVPPKSRPCRLALAADPLVLGLAQASGAAAAPLPASAGAWIEGDRETGNVLIVLDSLRAAAWRDDAHAWREQLSALDRDWLSPLALALRQHRIGMVSLHLLGPERTLEVETTAGDLRRFWRRPKPLAMWGG